MSVIIVRAKKNKYLVIASKTKHIKHESNFKIHTSQFCSFEIYCLGVVFSNGNSIE